MQKSKKSWKRLDKHQTDCNGLSNRFDQITRIIKEINPNMKDMNNIVETYRNKILEIDRELEQESIDFWNGDFELRKAIMFYLQEKVGIGISNVLNIAKQVSLISTSETITKTNKKRRRRYITNAIFNLNTANDYIENYDINENINETLLTYFLNIEYKNNLFQIYSKMKENINDLGLEDQYIESEILKIIEYRAKNKYEYNKEALLKEIYEDLGFEKTETKKDRIRERTL